MVINYPRERWYERIFSFFLQRNHGGDICEGKREREEGEEGKGVNVSS